MKLVNGKRYRVILADPPWKHKAWTTPKTEYGVAASHYPVMDTYDIERLPVHKIADADSVLFLWVSSPMLKDGLRILRAWGFKYVTVAFVWVKLSPKTMKPRLGLGMWTRSECELCLLGRRGKVKRIEASVRQTLLKPIGRHSAKPVATYKRIERLMGPCDRIELFARSHRAGWDAWGDEV